MARRGGDQGQREMTREGEQGRVWWIGGGGGWTHMTYLTWFLLRDFRQTKLPSPSELWWRKDGETWKPFWITISEVAQCTNELVKCKCKGNYTSCWFGKANSECTLLCKCKCISSTEKRWICWFGTILEKNRLKNKLKTSDFKKLYGFDKLEKIC